MLPRAGTSFAKLIGSQNPTAPIEKEVAAMPGRPSWDGYLKFNLLAIPVKAYNATLSGEGKIAFHQVHKTCGSRIRYKKFCPVHGEVPKEEIAPAHEVAKGQYVIVEPDELDKLAAEDDKTITIDVCVDPDVVDPAYFSGRTYYLVPDGRVAQKPYAVLQEVLAEQNRYGIAKLALAGREQIAVVRAVDNLLAVSLLYY